MENNRLKKKENFEVYITMEKAIIKSGDAEIERYKFHQYKKPVSK